MLIIWRFSESQGKKRNNFLHTDIAQVGLPRFQLHIKFLLCNTTHRGNNKRRRMPDQGIQEVLAYSQNHRITEHQELEGTSKDPNNTTDLHVA